MIFRQLFLNVKNRIPVVLKFLLFDLKNLDALEKFYATYVFLVPLVCLLSHLPVAVFDAVFV